MKDVTFAEWSAAWRIAGRFSGWDNWQISYEWNHNQTLKRCSEFKQWGAVAFLHITEPHNPPPSIQRKHGIMGLIEASCYIPESLCWVAAQGYVLPLSVNSRFAVKQAIAWLGEIPRAA